MGFRQAETLRAYSSTSSESLTLRYVLNRMANLRSVEIEGDEEEQENRSYDQEE